MQSVPPSKAPSERSRLWADTMAGHGGGDVRTAHADSSAVVGPAGGGYDRSEREAQEEARLAPGASRLYRLGHTAV